MGAKISKTLGHGGEGTAAASGTASLRAILASIVTDLGALATSLNQLLSDYNAHAHGGVTTGTDTSTNVADSTAAAVTIGTTVE